MSSAPTAKKDGEAKAAAAGHPSGDKRFKMLDVTIKRLLYQQDALIEVLHSAKGSSAISKTMCCFTSPGR